jgi:hypothetical protein
MSGDGGDRVSWRDQPHEAVVATDVGGRIAITVEVRYPALRFQEMNPMARDVGAELLHLRWLHLVRGIDTDVTQIGHRSNSRTVMLGRRSSI